MLKKIIEIFKKLFPLKFRIFTPKNTNLIIFDNIGLKDLEVNLLKRENYFVLKNRKNELDEIYVSFKLLINFIFNLGLFFRKNFFYSRYLFFIFNRSFKTKSSFHNNRYQHTVF